MRGRNKYLIQGLGTFVGLVLANMLGATLAWLPSNGSEAFGAVLLIGVGIIVALVGWRLQQKIKAKYDPSNERGLIVYYLLAEVLTSFGVILVILMLFWIVLRLLTFAIE